MTSTRASLAAAALLLISATARPAAAQEGISLMHDGDCKVTVTWPAGTDISGFRLLINGQPATKIDSTSGPPFIVLLGDPLRERDNVLVSAGGHQYNAVVNPSSGDGPAADSCSVDMKSRDDERAVFEASGFLGSVFDNFAPNVAGGYVNPESAVGASTVKTRWTAGVTAQYRLWGNPGDTRQLWLSSYTLHGVRTADVNCNDSPQPPVCSTKATTDQKFLYIVQHASTLEAHVDAHFEFLTLQKDSEMPIKVFAAARFGFLDLEGAPRVYNSNSLGVGVLAPKGAFRNSLAQVGWGLSEQFGSDPKWNRLKINGLLAFDLMPSLRDRVEFWKRFGGATRFFVEISVDRNLRQGPDAVQTYVGLLFDLRQVFGGFQP